MSIIQSIAYPKPYYYLKIEYILLRALIIILSITYPKPYYILKTECTQFPEYTSAQNIN